MKTVELTPVAITPTILEELDNKGLIMTFKPTLATLNPPVGENVGEDLYVSEPRFGSHKLIAVGINKTKIRLGVHDDNEEFLLPNHGMDVKPVYLVICHLDEQQLRKKDKEGTLATSDFTCLCLYPAPRGAEMFTMLKDTVHCEATRPGDGEIGCFYVTESSDLNMDWVDLEQTEVIIR